MPNDPMADIRNSFFLECEDLLEGLQDALEEMESGTADSETVNVVFRAVHSIKGGAGAFGMHDLAAFAHRFETVLEELRCGRIEAHGSAVRPFFQAADLLHDHVHSARDETPPPAQSEATLLALEALTDITPSLENLDLGFAAIGLNLDFPDIVASASDAGIAEFIPVRVAQIEVADANICTNQTAWKVCFTPRAGLYESGNEAAHLLRSLSNMGEALITCQIPTDLELTEICAEVPRLTWNVGLIGDITREEIEEIFDFVSDICDIKIAEADQGDTKNLFLCSAEPPTNTEKAELPEIFAQQSLSPVNIPDLLSCPTPTADKGSAEVAPITVRVDLAKIDRLVNLVGELVINQAMLSQSVSLTGPANAEITAGLEAFMTLTRDIQDSVMSVRAQPVKPLFQRMSRIVREASASVGKIVRLKTKGENTEVDKTIIERLADPLTHMIRNAVDHGLETPEVRLAALKPPEGQITLTAYHRAGRIMIDVSDDGGGINRPKIQAIATKKGLIVEGAILTDAEIDNLLFLPGFSTADTVSTLSGRGVGLDVVKSTITALGGRISITSEARVGTTMSISLPLTLAVLDGMIVTAAGQTLVIPLSAIVETAALSPEEIKPVGSQCELLQVRGKLLPLIDLAERLGFRASGEINRNGIALLTAQENGRYAALVVDTILEQRQVVIKGLSTLFGQVPGVAAATILGDGRIALILDPADLMMKTRSAPIDIALAG